MREYFLEKELFCPFRIFGNLYFVGAIPASAHLVDTGDGLLLLDAGYPHSFDQICQSIGTLGFDPKDIRLICLTHGHIDHFGAVKKLKELSGAKVALGAEDETSATGELPLSYSEEFHTTFTETFRPDILLKDGDEVSLGNTTVRAVATRGHTQGAMSLFFDVTDGNETLRAALHGGAGMNTLSEKYLNDHNIPLSIREDFVAAMKRLNGEKVEIFLGNHFGQCRGEEKYRRLLEGDKYAFVDPEGWKRFNLSCIRSLERLTEKELQMKSAPPAFSFTYANRVYQSAALPFVTEGEDRIYPLGDGVQIRLSSKKYPDFDAVEWLLHLENNGPKDSAVFSEIWDCATLLPLSVPPFAKKGYLPDKESLCVSSFNGMVKGRYYSLSDSISASEFNLHRHYLEKQPQKKLDLANEHGRSSETLMPFFDVSAAGAGFLVAVGWSGNWRARFETKDNGVFLSTGLQNARFYLKAGESLRTSSVLLMNYGANEDRFNKFRRLLYRHVSHVACTKAEKESLLAVEFWGGLPTHEIKRRIGLLKQYEIPFEEVWIDAGWYGKCEKCDDTFSGDWSEHTGEWEMNLKVHPQALQDVAELAEEAGMKMMLWVEPERAVIGTRVPKEHPDWFLFHPDKDYALLNYGNPEAFQYAYEILSGYCQSLRMGCYRQDFNVRPAESFAYHDEADRQGITEIEHITGMYRLWDKLLEEFPHLLIDNCASGGRRIDIETMKRSVPFFRSDYQCNFNENPEVLQTHNANASLFLPTNGCTTKTKGDLYAVRSSYSASWGAAFFSAVFQTMEEEDLLWAKRVTEEYRRIRRFYSKDFYNHGSSVYDDTSWAIWQYHDPESQKGILLSFRRSNSPFESVSVTLKGLPENARLHFTDADRQCSWEGDATLPLTLPEKRSCLLLEYEAL